MIRGTLNKGAPTTFIAGWISDSGCFEAKEPNSPKMSVALSPNLSHNLGRPISASGLLLLLLVRSPHSDIHASLLYEGSSFADILWAAVELCLQG